MNTTHEEKQATRELLNKTRIYLLDNFHKFSEYNKIKVALALNLRAMPQQIEQEIKVTTMSDIKLNGKALEIDIGKYNRITRDAFNPGEITSSNNEN